MNLKTMAIILFIALYALMITLPKRRVWVAFGAACLSLVLGILPVERVLHVINWNVLMMISGTMIVVDYFIESKMPNRIADVLLDKSKNVKWVTILMSLFAGIISAFIDNVATVLMVAPVALAICKQLKISPVAMILAIAVSSNLQGAATLVGDTTSIMLGGYADMNFIEFFWMNGRPGIFFAVELGALATIPVLMFLFRKDTQPVKAGARTEVKGVMPTVMLCLVVILLIIASFLPWGIVLPDGADITNGVICITLAVLTILLDGLTKRDWSGAKRSISALDWETLLLLASLFCVIAGLTEVGVIEDMAGWITKAGGNNLFLLYTVVVWGSVLISAFVDNIPYVATMLPVLQSVTSMMGIPPYLLYFGLLSGATLGGNLTPIGASANIAAVGLLRKQGEEVSFGQFMRIGVPLTLTAVMAGYIYLWVVWR